MNESFLYTSIWGSVCVQYTCLLKVARQTLLEKKSSSFISERISAVCALT